MSLVKVQGNASGTGIFTVAAPNSNTDRTLTLPDSTGTIATAESTLSQFNVSGSAPVYACRAWVNFNGTASSNLTGTYSQSGTTITITITNHGLIAGNGVYITFQSGAATAEAFTVVSVTNANVFVVTSATSRTTSGNCTANFNTIRASGNVSSITDNGTGNYTVNFTTALPDANYGVSFGSGFNYGAVSPATIFANPAGTNGAKSTASLSLIAYNSSFSIFDPAEVYLAIFR